MLLQFSVENYLSIKEKLSFSMLASSDTEHMETLISSCTKVNLLKSAVIYGANASGKSNVLNAFWFMVNYVLTSHEKQLNKWTNRTPFKFNKDTPNRPSSFEVIFTTSGIRYAYGFSVTDKEVTEEYLYYYPNGRQALIFERKDVDNYRFTTDIELQNSLKDRNSHNKLYLSTAANWNYNRVKPVFEWFASCVILTKDSPCNAYHLNLELLHNEEYRGLLASMMHVADFGICDLSVKSAFFDNSLTVEPDSEIDAVHIVENEEGISERYVLNMSEESAGTNSYFRLSGLIIQVLEQGTLLVADEIDAHLHPLLTQHLIEIFNSSRYNPKGAQLIFTSHNTNLLDLELLRRDQIWFTEKDEKTSATDLFSLYDFSVRKDAKIEKNYLLGRYGAIPLIRRGV